MKSLYIIRHAKSSWGDFSLPDFERPLNERGKKDAPVMAQRLLDKNTKIDLFISSPAKRALKTCKLFCKEFNVPEEAILVIDELYHASKEIFYNVIGKIDNKYEHVAIFSHNPGISEFVNSLNTNVHIDTMPTCAIFAVSIDCKSWDQFESAQKIFIRFDFPKSL